MLFTAIAISYIVYLYILATDNGFVGNKNNIFIY